MGGTGSTHSRPARCSTTRWRVDGEALAAERPSCSPGHLPIKAGTLLFTHTHTHRTPANPTDSEREGKRERSHHLKHPPSRVKRRNKDAPLFGQSPTSLLVERRLRRLQRGGRSSGQSNALNTPRDDLIDKNSIGSSLQNPLVFMPLKSKNSVSSGRRSTKTQSSSGNNRDASVAK